MKRCVINFSRNTNRRGWVEDGQKRIKQSFIDKGFDGDFLLLNKEKDFGSPKMEEIPYAFKACLFKYAMEQGYDQIIWVDASVVLTGNPHQLYDQLNRDGYVFLKNGWNTGQWCSDKALETLGITRECSFTIPHLMANVMALDVSLERPRRFLQEYYKKSIDGITLMGDWSNDKGQVSKDKRVLGHRHDQTAGSVIAWRMDMLNWMVHWLQYGPIDKPPYRDSVIFKCHPI